MDIINQYSKRNETVSIDDAWNSNKITLSSRLRGQHTFLSSLTDMQSSNVVIDMNSHDIGSVTIIFSQNTTVRMTESQ